MKTKNYILLFYRQLAGRLDETGARELSQASTEEDKEAIGNALERIWEGSGHYGLDYQPNVEAGLDTLRRRIGAERNRQHRARRLRARRRWLSAAAVFLFLPAAAWWLWLPAAGKGEPATMIADTGYGEKERFALPDGSVVILNENSRLAYPDFFAEGEKRTVRLTGEAFFQVERRADQPFVILTGEVGVTVLGTAFNLRAYPDESFTEVEVAEGRVRMEDNRGRSVELTREERGICRHGEALFKMPAANLNAASWQTGRLQFRNTPVPEVINALERHFSIRIELDGNEIQHCTFDSNFENARLGDIFTTLEIVFGAEIQPAGKGHYRLRGGKCN